MQNKGQRNLVNTINKRDENKKQTDVDIRHRFFLCTIVGSSKKVSKREKKPRPRKKGLYEELLSRIADGSSKQPLLHWFTG